MHSITITFQTSEQADAFAQFVSGGTMLEFQDYCEMVDVEFKMEDYEVD